MKDKKEFDLRKFDMDKYLFTIYSSNPNGKNLCGDQKDSDLRTYYEMTECMRF